MLTTFGERRLFSCARPLGASGASAHLHHMKAAVLYALAILALALIWPLAAWLGSRQGKRARGGIALMLFGLGQVTDPPSKHLIEAQEGEEKEAESTGEPKDPSPKG